MKREWCTKRTTINDAELENIVKDPRLDNVPLPFGFIFWRWVDFREKLREGDELWEFKSPQKSWDNLAGREGYCIVRDGKVVEHIITVMS